MFELKPISKEAIPRALAKAERYRLLNEPREAESICRDILAIDAGNQEAIVCLILALTDQFNGRGSRSDEAQSLVDRLQSPYERAYYLGVIEERWAKALIGAGRPPGLAYGFVVAAMEQFAESDEKAPEGNEDAHLRWNACVRLIRRYGLTPPEESRPRGHDVFDDEVPHR